MKSAEDSYHEGRPIVRSMLKRPWISVVCPYGHVITAMHRRASDPSWVVRCYGTIHV